MSRPQPPYGTYIPPVIVRILLWLAHRSFLGRGKFRDYTYFIIKLFHNQIVDMHIWGAPIRIDPRTNPLEREPMLRYDRVDRRERALMRHFLDKHDAIFVDLGANMGLYSFDAAINGLEGIRVICVEANPMMASRLGFNIGNMQRANVNNTSNMILFPVAVGAINGNARMNVAVPEHIASLFEADNIPADQTISVPVRPLSDILAEAHVKYIDFLKIDVEGYEGEALGPFLEQAEDTMLPRCIQIEHNASDDWSMDVFGLLTQRGYEEVLRIGMNAFWTLPHVRPSEEIMKRIQNI